MNSTRTLWFYLAALLAASFSVLLWTGGEIYRAAPPMPEQVVSADAQVIYTRADIELGRQVRQSMGGMQLGSIWVTAPMSHPTGALIGCIGKL